MQREKRPPQTDLRRLQDRERLLKQEHVLDELSTRLLAGVGAHFGRESDQYEKAGGKRPSARKSSRKPMGAMTMS